MRADTRATWPKDVMTNETTRPNRSGNPRAQQGGKPRFRSDKPNTNHRRHRAEPEEKFIRRAIPEIDTAFTRMGIDARVAINLPGLGIETPSPIQEKSIPGIVAGRDLLGLAQTGTGKTAAFGLPMLTRLLNIGRKPEPRTCRALILARPASLRPRSPRISTITPSARRSGSSASSAAPRSTCRSSGWSAASTC